MREPSNLDQAVGGERQQSRDRFGEIRIEVDVEARFDLRAVDDPPAHELLDHLRTQHVVFVELEPARDRQAALVHRGFPCGRSR